MAFALSSDYDVVTSKPQLNDFSYEILHCLHEMEHSLGKTLPKFPDIKAGLPALQDTLKRFREDMNAGAIGEDIEKTLLHARNGCRELSALLGTLVAIIVQTPGDFWRSKNRKVFSLHEHADDQSIIKILRNYIQILKSYHAIILASLQPFKHQKLLQIRNWLSAPDPSPNYQRALKQRQDGTGRWFLKSEQYNKWKTEAASLLWLQGPPGCGKTILSTTVIQDMIRCTRDDPGKRVVYYYFDFRDAQKQRSKLMVKSIITQLLQDCMEMLSALESLFWSCVTVQQRPSLNALLAVLQQLLKENSLVSYLVLDGLDECSSRAELMGIIRGIASWRIANAHILVATRKEQDIESSLEPIVHDSMYLQSYIVDEDIRTYVHKRLSEDQEMRQEIEAALMQQADGR